MMTYDERRDIELYIDIVGKNIKRLERSVDILKEALEKLPCKAEKENDQKQTDI